MNKNISGKNDNHTFVVCAYKESKYLEMCVKSVLRQTVKSRVIMCTATPCDYINNIAEKYNIELKIRHGNSDMIGNWNFAVSCADTELVTVVHQDDVYHSKYVEYMLAAMKKRPDSNIFFSGYRPIKKGKPTIDANCVIRGILRIPMRFNKLAGIRVFKKLIFSFGNCVCCPTVTYSKKRLGENIFTTDYKFNVDWDTFLRIADMKGSFAYDHHPLVGYRIHNGASSKEFIDNSGRYKEDMEMFEKIWGKRMAHIIMRFYTKAYDTYN